MPAEAVLAPDPVAVFDHLLPDALRAQYTAVPAERVTVHVLDLPVRTARQRRDALPFALEEAVGRPLDQTHFAICDTFPDGRLLVAVIDAAVMRQHVDTAPERPIIAEQMLLPPPTPDDRGQPGWRCYRAGDRVLVRASDGTGFAARADMLPLLWALSGKPWVEPYGEGLDAQITRLSRPDGPVPPPPALDRHDLRQGAFRPSRRLGRPLRWLAASVVLALLAHLGILAADIRAQRDIADRLQTAATVALNRHLPGASSDANPALLVRQIAAEAAVPGGSGFLPLMDDVSQAWLRDGAQVQLRELVWSDDVLRLVVETPDLESLQRAEASLSAAGLRVGSGSATADAGSARAELTVRP